MKYWIITALLFISSEVFALVTDSLSLSLALVEKKIFQTQDPLRVNELLVAKSDIEVDNNRPEDAIRTLRRIDTLHFSTGSYNAYYFKLSLASILSTQFDQALEELSRIRPQNDSELSEIRFLTVFILNEMENFEDCNAALIRDSMASTCTAVSPTSIPLHPAYKDPGKAFRLSSFLPGAGQTYAGHFGKGLLSFALTAGFMTFGVYNFIDGYYAMSVVSGLFPALKFYQGGKRLSESLALKYNSEKTMELKRLYRSQIYMLNDCK